MESLEYTQGSLFFAHCDDWEGVRFVYYVLLESTLYHNFGYIFLGFSPFPRRTHRVRTAGMSLSKKNLSRNSSIKRLREYIT